MFEPAGGAVGKVVEPSGGEAFLEEAGPWGWFLRFHSIASHPVQPMTQSSDSWLQCDKPHLSHHEGLYPLAM